MSSCLRSYEEEWCGNVEKKEQEIIELLLSAKADVHIKTNVCII